MVKTRDMRANPCHVKMMFLLKNVDTGGILWRERERARERERKRKSEPEGVYRVFKKPGAKRWEWGLCVMGRLQRYM